jgi:acyl carrier protein
MTRDEIFAALQALVAESLAIGKDEVALGSRLIPDLGADSLDFIDMIFAIEKRFGIQARGGELDFFTRLDFSSPEVLRDGALTPQTVERLLEWLPLLRAMPQPRRVTPRDVFGMITVETLVDLVAKRLPS